VLGGTVEERRQMEPGMSGSHRIVIGFELLLIALLLTCLCLKPKVILCVLSFEGTMMPGPESSFAM
jgi:hypothetical protein